jgi:diacylglycerol kinase family enzyme
MISDLNRPNEPLQSSLSEGAPLFSNVLIIINPTSGTARRRKKLKTILAHLQMTSGHLEIIYTASALHATEVVKEKRRAGFSLIICAGGDGTINEVINGFLAEDDSHDPEKEAADRKDRAALPLPSLAILPTGTGNGLAREIGIPLDPLAAYQAILTGIPRPVYPGKVRILDPRRETSSRYFILFVGAGFDGYVITWIDRRQGIFRRLPKLWIYFLFGFAALFSYSHPIIHFSVDGVPYSGSTGLITRAKLVLGPFTLAPPAGIERPTLTLCLFKSNGIVGYFKTLFGLFLGEAAKGIKYIEGKEIKVIGNDQLIHADGESLGTLPAILSISEKPLYLVYPRSSRSRGTPKSRSISPDR